MRSNSNHLKNLDPRESAVSNALNNPNEVFDYFYKIIVIGDEGVGKTNFLLRVAKNYYDPSPKQTYGVEFLFRSLSLPNSNQKVKAQIWDTSGSKDFLDITTTHYRFAVGAFLVYDVTNRKSFLNLKDWLYKVREYSDRSVIVALIGNKGDLVDKQEGLSNLQQHYPRT